MKRFLMGNLLAVLFCFIVAMPQVVAAEGETESEPAAAQETAAKNVTADELTTRPVVIANNETGIPDVNFYNVLLEAADSDKNGELTRIELAELKELNASGKNIENVKGLEYCISLEILNLSNNQIEDVTPLRNLSYIRELDITCNRIADLSPLKDSSLTMRLRELAINKAGGFFRLGRFEGSSQPESWIKMAYGNLYTQKQAREILPEELLNYQYGVVNSINGTFPLELTWIMWEYNENDVVENNETGIPDPAFYQAVLEYGDLNKDGILTRGELDTAYTYGYYTDGKTTLNAGNMGIKSIEGIQYLFTNYDAYECWMYIDLSYNHISDICPLATYSGIHQIDLSHNQISDISPFEHCFNLKFFNGINLGYNQITDISALKYKAFKNLNVEHNQISDLSPLAYKDEESAWRQQIRGSWTLDVSNNCVTDISMLAECEDLSSLYLNGNRIESVSAIQDIFYNNFCIEENYLEELSEAVINHLYDKDRILIIYRYLDEQGNSIEPAVYRFIVNKSYKADCYSGAVTQKYIEGYTPANEEYKEIRYNAPYTATEPYYVDFYYVKDALEEPTKPNEEEPKPSEPETPAVPENPTESVSPINPTEPDKIVDVTGDTCIPEKNFENIIAENTIKDIIIQTKFDISFIFDKGTMEKVDGKNQYDFGVTITTDYGKVDNEPKHHFREHEMVSYVHFEYSGKLPGNPWIKIPVGANRAGQTLFYYYYNEAEGKLELVYSAKVDTDGYLVVRQSHCSDYVILSKEVTAEENPPQQPEEKEEEENSNEALPETAPVSPKTADKSADMGWLTVLIAVSLCVAVVAVMKKDIKKL